MHGLWHEPGQEMIDLCLMTVVSRYRRYLWKSSRVVDYIIDILTNWHPLACCLCSAWQEPITYFEQEIERYIAAHKRLLEHLGFRKGWFGFLLTFLELDATPVLSIRKAQKHLSSRWICWWISHWRVEHFQPRMSVAPGEPYRLYGEARNKTVLGSFPLRGAHHARLLLVVVCKPSTFQPNTFDIIYIRNHT